MSLTPGSQLGSYEIQSLLGEGGMGQVYKARDGKLGRDVAIKVLPASVANDPERLGRFERERSARVMVAVTTTNQAPREIRVVTNWQQEIAKKLK